MGDHGVNIARMAVGQDRGEKQNIIFLTTDVSIDDNLMNELQDLENIFSVRKIEL
jgi:hypothetical protein